MAAKWFRFHDDYLNDPKIQTLEPYLFKAWVNLLCLANGQADRGILPDAENVAWRLRIPLDSAASILESLLHVGLLVASADGRLTPRDWDEMQKGLDTTSTERVRRYRERQKAKGK